LTNAVKFTPNDGEVSIALEQTDEAICITVADNGEGIAPDFLPFVFDRFRQADSSSTRKHNGLGLGLAIVRHLAELHGGAVSVTREGEGKGATFAVTLPLSIISEMPVKAIKEKTNGHKSRVNSRTELSGIRVLIVDDDADTCEMLTFALSLLGAEAQASY